LGHEFSGEVVQLGDGVEDFKVGDRVSAAPATWCGECFYCRREAKTLCLNPIDFGSTHMGALAEYVIIPAIMVEQGGLVVLPDEVPFERGALLEPLGTCIRGMLTQGKLEPDQNVVIVGDGPIGLLQVMLAKRMGASWVLCVGHHDDRLAKAKQLGADQVVNSKEMTPDEVVHDQTQGMGADLIIVSVPSAEANQAFLKFVRGSGHFVIFGGVPRESTISVDPNFLHYDEIVLTGSYNCTVEEFQYARDLSKDLALEEIISHKVPLGQIHAGLEIISRREGLKVLVVM
jgi:L-iditol 2-dehydrogenase